MGWPAAQASGPSPVARRCSSQCLLLLRPATLLWGDLAEPLGALGPQLAKRLGPYSSPSLGAVPLSSMGGCDFPVKKTRLGPPSPTATRYREFGVQGLPPSRCGCCPLRLFSSRSHPLGCQGLKTPRSQASNPQTGGGGWKAGCVPTPGPGARLWSGGAGLLH